MEEMTENELKKRYLWGYRAAIRQMERSELRIREIRLNKMMPTVIADGMPHAHGGEDMSRYAALLDQEEKKYLKARYRRIRLCQEITNKIERMESEDEKDILFYRYIKLMKWEEICAKMKHSWQHVHRIHARALKNFKM